MTLTHERRKCKQLQKRSLKTLQKVKSRKWFPKVPWRYSCMKIIKGRFKYNFEDALKHKIAKTVWIFFVDKIFTCSILWILVYCACFLSQRSSKNSFEAETEKHYMKACIWRKQKWTRSRRDKGQKSVQTPKHQFWIDLYMRREGIHCHGEVVYNSM